MGQLHINPYFCTVGLVWWSRQIWPTTPPAVMVWIGLTVIFYEPMLLEVCALKTHISKCILKELIFTIVHLPCTVTSSPASLSPSLPQILCPKVAIHGLLDPIGWKSKEDRGRREGETWKNLCLYNVTQFDLDCGSEKGCLSVLYAVQVPSS